MIIQQSDRWPIRRQLFLWFAVILILFGSGGCAPVPTPTSMDTLAPSSTATPEPTDTLTPPPTETPAPPTTTPMTPTPKLGAEASPAPTKETLDIPLGIGIYDRDNVAFFNKYASERDVIGARPPLMDFLDEVDIGKKILVFAPRDERLTDVSSVISEAKARGITILGYNLETALPKEDLINREMGMQRFASEDELLYVFGPTLLKLERYYDDFARHADIILLQSQRYQTREEYEERVEKLIEKIRCANPEVKVWVQVSVNPPEKRHIMPDEVISDIQLIADKADLIWIYFGPRTARIMEEVFRRLRQ